MKEIPYKEVEGISVSGGEPFEQAEELLELLCLSKAAGLSRLVYTGFKYEELTGKEESRIREILSLTDILIDGAYEEESAVDELWAGSANQRALELKEGNIAGFYNLTKKEEDAGCEIIIDKEGCILVTGIVKSAFTIVE
jgi:anaerobic ribonucleoside-triphosphate reductase activating protein